jgi:metal-responsive CopG/Arc/MetJ family transcriptional regulator
MTRILADLPEDDIQKLDALAAKAKRSRAAEIREAVRLYLIRNSGKDWIRRGAGYWADRDDIGDAVEYQRAIREDRASFD